MEVLLQLFDYNGIFFTEFNVKAVGPTFKFPVNGEHVTFRSRKYLVYEVDWDLDAKSILVKAKAVHV